MGRRRGRKVTEETLISTHENVEIDEETEENKGDKFFACYLLTSVCPRFKGHTYIGFTVNPRRRIRQHNGEIGSGAWRTKRKRPWEMVLCIYGFPTNVAALQFEWAWQHPAKSLAVRTAAASFKSVSGLANKIKMAYTMLTLPAWQNLNLTMNFFSTKYRMHISSCPPLPQQMQIKICLMDDLPCYNEDYSCMNDDEQDIDEECDANNSFQASQESSEVIETVPDSSRTHGSYEENDPIQITDKDDSSYVFNLVTNERNIDEECDANNSFQASEESTEVIETVCDSSRIRGSYEENDHIQIIDKNDSSCVFPEENLVTDEEPLPMNNFSIRGDVEVIDLFTPSPCYRVNSGSKKRSTTVYPEIIDLTNSPLFV